MKNYHFPFIAVFFVSAVLALPAFAEEAPVRELTLKGAYALALKRSETIAINEQVIKESEGKFSQALSTALPQVSWDAASKWQDRSSDNLTRRYTPNSYFTFTQPLFSGFKEFAAISASRTERKQHQAELDRAKQLLFVDVSDAFYFLKSYEEEMIVLQATSDALSQRQKELERRQQLGRSRASEVASINSRFYQHLATIEDMRSKQMVARQLLEFLTGIKIDHLKDQDVLIDDIGPLERYLKNAETRPDVMAAQHASEVSRKKVTVAQAGYWPTVNLVGNSYTKRVGTLADSDWDLTLNITVPIFTSGLTKGNVTQAKAIAQEDVLRFSEVKRKAVLDISNAHTALMSDLKRVKVLAQAVDAAQKNYDLQTSDYANNLVNNLDVLQALEDLQTVKEGYVSVKNETQRAFWSFQAAIGALVHDAI